MCKDLLIVKTSNINFIIWKLMEQKIKVLTNKSKVNYSIALYK